MAGKPKRGIELRQKLHQARNNENISLPLNAGDFGEYQGPFILNKPLTLIGQGEKTPLLAKGSPAVIILSPGVKLVNLEISNSYTIEPRVSMLIEERANPILENVKINGQKIIMSREHLIDLGDFLPSQQASSFIEVEVAGPAQIRCAENSKKWLQVSTTMLPAAGKYLLQILCDAKALGADGIAAGNIEIVTGATTRSIWVTAHVLSAPPPRLLSGAMALLLGKDQRIRFGESFLIGKSRFPGVPQASSMAEKQAIILKEASSGGWVIYQPWQTPTPTLVNGQPLAQGQRVLLQEGAMIRAGNLDLKAETFSGAGNYAVNKMLINLGTPGQAPVDSGFQLRYQAGGKDKAKVVATVPWIQASPGEVELRKDETRDILLTLTPAARNLPPIKQRERSAILVQGKNETLSLDVDVEILAETIIPRATPDSIKLGTVIDWSKAQATVVIFNDGTKEWKPTLHASQDWLSVEPTNLVVSPGKSANFTVRLNQKVERLPSPGDHSAAVTLDGDGVPLKLNVSVRLQLQEVDPVLETPVLDFKELADWDRASPAILILRNKGNKEWNALLRTALPWLDIAGDKNIVVTPGGQKTIAVQINANLPVGEHAIADGIVIEGDGRRLAVAVKAKLNPPTSSIELFPRLIDFGKFEDWNAAPLQSVIFRNRGNADWNGVIHATAAWLDLQHSENLTCAAKSEATILLRVNQHINEGQHSIPDGLVFEGPGGPYRLAVKAHFDPRPKIRLMPISFGQVADWATAPQMTIPIYNDGNQDWIDAQVSCNVPWLEVSPGQISVSKNGRTEITARLNERLNELPAGSYQPDAIVLSKGIIQLAIRVELSLPSIELQASDKEISFNLDEDTPLSSIQKSILISNVGGRSWTGKIKAAAPWLKIAPQSATIGIRSSENITIDVDETVRGLGTGEKWFGSLITFENSSLALDVRVNIRKKPIISDMLEIEPAPVDFGKFEEAVKKPGIELSIFCERDWQAILTTTDNWFKAAQNTLSGIAGKPGTVRIELTEQAAKLPNDVHWGVLHVTAQNGRSYKIDVKLDKKAPVYKPSEWSIHPEGITFGSVEKSAAWDVHPTEDLIVNNKGNQEIILNLKILEGDNWIDAPGMIRVPPRAERRTSIRLKKGAWNYLRLGKPKGRIELSGAGKPVELIVTLQLVPESLTVIPVQKESSAATKTGQELQIDPVQLVFTETDPSHWKNVPGQKVNIYNPNGFRWSGLIRSEDWVSTPATLDVEAYGKASIDVHLKPSPFIKEAQEYNKADAVIIWRAGESYPIRVIVGTVSEQPIIPEQPTKSPPAALTTSKKHEPEKSESKSTLFGPKPMATKPDETAPPATPAVQKTASNSITQPPVQIRPTQPDLSKSTLFGVKSTPAGSPFQAQANPLPVDAIKVQPGQVDFGRMSNWNTTAPQNIHIHNKSNQPIQLSVITVDWLKASENQVTCPPNTFIAIQVSLFKTGGVFAQITKGLRSDPCGIIIKYNEYAIPIPVSVETL